MRVLYIGGFGRSGTTLLSRLLGELPGVCAIGEAVNLWRQGIVRNEKCSCGQPFSSCPFWQEVGELAFGGWDRVDLDTVLGQSEDSRFRYAREAGIPLSLPASTPATNSYYLRLYSAVARVSGCPTVVDASKHAALLSSLRREKSLDMTVIHMVRDSRGVAYSWTKVRRRPESEDQSSFMNKFSVAHSAMLWNAYNVSLCTLHRSGVDYLRMRYEDLVRTPEPCLRKIAQAARLPDNTDTFDAGTFDFLGNGYADLASGHCIAGNPMRFQDGRVAIREDDEWRSSLPPRSQAMVTGLTFPMLAYLGYTRPSAGQR